MTNGRQNMEEFEANKTNSPFNSHSSTANAPTASKGDYIDFEEIK